MTLLSSVQNVVAAEDDGAPAGGSAEAVPPPLSEKEQKQHDKDVKEWELKMYDEMRTAKDEAVIAKVEARMDIALTEHSAQVDQKLDAERAARQAPTAC